MTLLDGSQFFSASEGTSQLSNQIRCQLSRSKAQQEHNLLKIELSCCHNTIFTSFTKLFKIRDKKLSIVKKCSINWQGMENIFVTKTFLQQSFFYTFTILLKVFLHRTVFNVFYTFAERENTEY